MKRDNRGVSLVEVLIVLAISTAMVTAMIVGVNMITGRPAQKCAQKLVYSLDRHRTSAMGKAETDTYYKIYQDASSGQIMVTESLAGNAKTVPVGEKGVSVVYKLQGAGETNVSATPLVLKFQRGTGAVKTSDDKICEEIIVSRGNKTYTVELKQLTGRVSMK